MLKSVRQGQGGDSKQRENRWEKYLYGASFPSDMLEDGIAADRAFLPGER